MPIYVQLEDQLLKVSGDVTSQSIEDALGYKPVSKDQLNNYYTKDEINSHIETDSLKATSIDAAIVSAKEIQDTNSNAFNITDKNGKIITTIDGVGISTVEVTLKDENGSTLHQLSQKANKDYVDQKFLELDNYYTKDEINSHIETDSLTATSIDVAIVSVKEIQDTDSNAFNITDKDGNIITTIDGVGISTVEVTLKDENGNTLHQLSQKANKDYVDQKFLELDNYYTKDEINSHIETDSLTATSIDVAIVSVKEIQDTDSNAFNITDKDGNIITTIDGVGISTVEVTLKDENGNTLHQLSQKANKDYVDQKFLELDNYYTKDEINSHIDTETLTATSIDAVIVSTIEIQDTDSNAFNITDKDGNIITNIDGTGISTVEVTLKDESGNTLHQLSQKADKDYVDGQDAATLNAAKEYAKTYTDGQITEVKSLITASTQFLGVASNEITDKSSTKPTIGGKTITPGDGDIVMYSTSEFIWSSGKWYLLGDTTAEMNAIKDLQNADTALGTRIDDEKAARESADQTLQTNINNEKAARESADTALGTRISNEITNRESEVSRLEGLISKEVTDRTNADTDIRTDISNAVDTNLLDADKVIINNELVFSNSDHYSFVDNNNKIIATIDGTGISTVEVALKDENGNTLHQLSQKADKDYVDGQDTATLNAAKEYAKNYTDNKNVSAESTTTNYITASADKNKVTIAAVTGTVASGDDKLAVASDVKSSLITVKDAIELSYKGADTLVTVDCKAYADELNTAMEARVDALDAAKHTHNNKTVLDGITSTNVNNWNNAQTNAIEAANIYTDGEIQVVKEEYAESITTKKLTISQELDFSNSSSYTFLDNSTNIIATIDNAGVKSVDFSALNEDGSTVCTLIGLNEAVSQKANKDYVDGKVKVVADVVGDSTKGLVKDVKSIQDELTTISGGVGSVGTQINNAIAALDLPNTYDAKGAAANALIAAKEYTDGKVDGKFDVKGAAAQALADAKSDAASKYQPKGDYETAGAAAQALADAKSDAASKYQPKGDYETAGAAAQALADAKADAATKYLTINGTANKALESTIWTTSVLKTDFDNQNNITAGFNNNNIVVNNSSESKKSLHMPSSEFGSMNAAGAFMQFGSNNWKCQLVAGSRGYGYTNTNGYSTPEGLYFRKHGEITHGAEGYGWTPWREIVSVDNAGKLCITHLDSKYHYTDGPTSVNNTLTIPYATNFSNENIYIGGKEALSYKTGTTSNLHLGYGNIGKYSTYINGKSIYMRYGGGTNGLILNNSGNMTIGSSDLAETSAKLYVDGTTKISGAVTMSSGLSVGDIITAHKQIQLYQEDEAYRLTMYENSNIARLYNVSADGQTMGDMYIGSNSNAAIVINSGSYVGIGTTPDKNYKLDVNGNTRISGNTTITGTCSASEGFFDTSDERLKDFQNDIEVDFEKLSKLPKKYFTWKDGDGELQIGTSAQEVQKIYPELVNEDENGTLSVSYNKLSIIALKAVDELYKKNQELEKRLERLEKLLA